MEIAWRQSQGWGSHGQRSHANNKTNKRTKILVNYRLEQFFTLFGKRKRNIYPTLVKGEYVNKF